MINFIKKYILKKRKNDLFSFNFRFIQCKNEVTNTLMHRRPMTYDWLDTGLKL